MNRCKQQPDSRLSFKLVERNKPDSHLSFKLVERNKPSNLNLFYPSHHRHHRHLITDKKMLTKPSSSNFVEDPMNRELPILNKQINSQPGIPPLFSSSPPSLPNYMKSTRSFDAKKHEPPCGKFSLYPPEPRTSSKRSAFLSLSISRTRTRMKREEEACKQRPDGVHRHLITDKKMLTKPSNSSNYLEDLMNREPPIPNKQINSQPGIPSLLFSPPPSPPNYMKSTSSFDSKKHKPPILKSRMKKSRSNPHPGIPSLLSSPPSPPNYMKSTIGFDAKKTTIFKPPRASTKKNTSVLINRDSCFNSSTLKNSKFKHGGNQLEGTSVFKVCRYTYSSLNGHHHRYNPPLPPLNRFIRSSNPAACLSLPSGISVGDQLEKVDDLDIANTDIESELSEALEMEMGEGLEKGLLKIHQTSNPADCLEKVDDLDIPNTVIESKQSLQLVLPILYGVLEILVLSQTYVRTLVGLVVRFIQEPNSSRGSDLVDNSTSHVCDSRVNCSHHITCSDGEACKTVEMLRTSTCAVTISIGKTLKKLRPVDKKVIIVWLLSPVRKLIEETEEVVGEGGLGQYLRSYYSMDVPAFAAFWHGRSEKDDHNRD